MFSANPVHSSPLFFSLRMHDFLWTLLVCTKNITQLSVRYLGEVGVRTSNPGIFILYFAQRDIIVAHLFVRSVCQNACRPGRADPVSRDARARGVGSAPATLNRHPATPHRTLRFCSDFKPRPRVQAGTPSPAHGRNKRCSENCQNCLGQCCSTDFAGKAVWQRQYGCNFCWQLQVCGVT